MKLGKILSVGEVVEHTAQEHTAQEHIAVETPVSEAVEVSRVAVVADLPAPVAAHAHR